MRIVLACLVAALAAHAQDTIAIIGATVVDGTGAPPRAATVLVRGARIAAVGPAVAIPAGARVIRAEGHTLLPGLFDLHTHMSTAPAPGRPTDWGKNRKAYLCHGVTTVLDVGTYPETFEPMRRLAERGTVEGPLTALAARLSTPGGHGAEAGRPDFFTQEVLTAREGRTAVGRALPYRPDAIRVFTDGWRYGFAPDMTGMEEATLAAIVDEAHRHNLPVITHTVTLAKALEAARAGVDIIGHGIGNADASEELLRLLGGRTSMYVSTLTIYEPRAGARTDPPRVARWRHLMHNVAALHSAGALFGVGTDAGMTGTYHGTATLRELELLVAGGLSPVEAIAAATGNAARALRVADERGTIAEGKLADLLLVEGAPDRYIAEIQKVRRVFLGGKEVDREGLAREIAQPGPTPLPPVKAAARIDDFESARSRVDTLWVNATDPGHDHTRMSVTRTLRAPRNHALSVIARMAEKDRAYARVSVPLARGAVEPVDASAFRGVRCEVRGDGPYRLLVPTRSGTFAAPFRAGARWTTVRIPFSALRREGAGDNTPEGWSGADLLMLCFEIARGAGESGWLEIDNVAFYK